LLRSDRLHSKARVQPARPDCVLIAFSRAHGVLLGTAASRAAAVFLEVKVKSPQLYLVTLPDTRAAKP
jgi:hypothetical protein